MAKGSDNPFPSVLLVESSAPATPSSGDQRLFIDIADHTPKLKDSTGAVTALGGGSGGSGGSLSHASDQLSADVTMASANTFYDGPSVSLAAGTWMLIGGITVEEPGAIGFITAKLWDGASAIAASAESQASSAAWLVPMQLSGIVSPSATTTYKISAACTSAGASIKAAAPDNGAGNSAAYLYAVKVG